MLPPEKLPQAYLALLGKSEAQQKEISALKSEMAAMELKLALFQKKMVKVRSWTGCSWR